MQKSITLTPAQLPSNLISNDQPATLVEATDANLYGATADGGANCAPYGCGTVFKITAGGTLTTLHSFDGTDGTNPWGVVLAIDGNFNGTTSGGGANRQGTVFKINPDLHPNVSSALRNTRGPHKSRARNAPVLTGKTTWP